MSIPSQTGAAEEWLHAPTEVIHLINQMKPQLMNVFNSELSKLAQAYHSDKNIIDGGSVSMGRVATANLEGIGAKKVTNGISGSGIA